MTDRPISAIILTPPGGGAIGVIRITGEDAFCCVQEIFHPSRGASVDEAFFDGGRLRYGTIIDEGEVIDDAIISRAVSQPVPVFDICVHGGVRVMERVLSTLESLGAKISSPTDQDGGTGLADPVARNPEDRLWPLSHPIEGDIVQVMGRAKTSRAVRFLAFQRSALPKAIDQALNRAKTDAEGAREILKCLLAGAEPARFLVEGAMVAIVGPPNSGKSTLFNTLVGRPSSIVSPRAGTTRDWVAEPVEIQGVSITLVDTAGRHETPDALERLAIRAGAESIRRADACVLVVDARHGDAMGEWLEGWEEAPRPQRALVAVNKIDQVAPHDVAALVTKYHTRGLPVIAISALREEARELVAGGLLTLLGFDTFIDFHPTACSMNQQERLRGLLDGPNDCFSDLHRTIHQGLPSGWVSTLRRAKSV